MPIPKPRKNEERDDFINRCHSALAGEYTDTEQRHAICSESWRDRNKHNIALLGVVTMSDYTIQRRRYEGKVHIVAPVVLMTVGVHIGSAGPRYYPEDELRKYPASWNGIAIPILHPFDEDGYPVSCNSPEILEKTVGRLFNVTFDNGKLKGELWLDEMKLSQTDPGLLAHILAGKMLEVSTGLFSDDDFTPGEWRGEHYDAVVRNIRPDHLALLPGQVGACSIDDGCGVRMNIKEGGEMEKEKIGIKYYTILSNEMSFGEIQSSIQKEVDKLDKRAADGTPVALNYVEAVFEDNFIFVEETQDSKKMFQQGYSITNDNKIMLEGEVKEVRREVSYVGVNVKNKDKEVTIMSETKPCCPKKVQALIDNEKTPFTIDDRGWLESMSEEAIDALSAKEFHSAPGDPPKTHEDAIKAIPEALRPELESGLKLHREQKDTLVGAIMKNELNQFTEDELKTKSVEELRKISGAMRIPDYSGRGGASENDHDGMQGGKVRVLALPSSEEEKKKE